METTGNSIYSQSAEECGNMCRFNSDNFVVGFELTPGKSCACLVSQDSRRLTERDDRPVVRTKPLLAVFLTCCVPYTKFLALQSESRRLTLDDDMVWDYVDGQLISNGGAKCLVTWHGTVSSHDSSLVNFALTMRDCPVLVSRVQSILYSSFNRFTIAQTP